MRTARAIRITTTGEVDIREQHTNLADLQIVVGGLLESLTLAEDGTHMYLDEEGKFKTFHRPNMLATLLADHYHPGFSRRDIIVGDVVVLGMGADGEEADVSQDVIDLVTGLAEGLRTPPCSANVGGDPASGCDNDALRGSDLCARHAEEAGER